MTQSDPHEPVTFTDKRRIDPVTGEVREAAEPAPSGPASEAPVTAADTDETDEAVELKATLQRVKAEYDNYRKRSVRQEQAAAERAKVGVAAQFLPVLDDLERARNHGDLETGPLKSVADKLTAALEGVGLVAFGAEGDEFDPSLHEAVQHEGDGSNPVIGTVMRQGYKLGDHILRHALVGVIDTVPDSDTADETGGSGSENIAANAESNE
ncbi:MAG TPA: nucleotide exchange factor GrpE [Mycobacterium sp.]